MIKSLQISHFRNYESAVVEFSPRINVFLGQNGQGKTNLLEALKINLTGESFRPGDLDKFIQFGHSKSFLRSRLKIEDLTFDLLTEIEPKKKTHQMNSKKTSSLELQRRFKSVVFSPESLTAIKDGADQRRRLLDEFLMTHNSQNIDVIASYRKVLKSRNKVLKELSEGLGSRSELLKVLEALNVTFLMLGAKLSSARIQAIRDIKQEFSRAMNEISGTKNVDISVEYVISSENGSKLTEKEIFFLLQKRLEELHDAELSSGTSLVGPHKHDIIILYNEKDSRFYCSQGQQRALILSFKMAQIVYHQSLHGVYPVLMLDDVLSELDAPKRDSLIRFLSEINAQIFITTTDFTLPSNFEHLNCKVIRVSEGATG
jgi:DNA replication and repair protein RecF